MPILTRIILASTDEHEWILDPFAGSSTTGIVANLCGRRYLGIDKEIDFARLGKNRREEINSHDTYSKYRGKLSDLIFLNQRPIIQENIEYYGLDLPF